MIIVSIAFVILCMLSVRRKEKLTGNALFLEGYSLENVNALKGLLAISVVLCHMTSRVDQELPFNFAVFGTTSVGLFFFLSGYGLIISAEKRPMYMTGFLKKRFVSILIPYILMMICYAAYCMLCEKSLGRVMVSFVNGWPVSNSWYVFAYLYCCICFWLIFRKGNITEDCGKKLLRMAFGLTLYTVLTCAVLRWQDWWYKTIVCFLIGLLWGIFRNKIQKALAGYYLLVLSIAIAFVFAAYVSPAFMRRMFGMSGNLVWTINDFLMGVSSTVLVGLLLYKFSVRNRITDFLGSISYEIYLFHGLLMDAWTSAGGGIASSTHTAQEAYSVSIVAVTMVVAIAAHKFAEKLKKRSLTCQK